MFRKSVPYNSPEQKFFFVCSGMFLGAFSGCFGEMFGDNVGTCLGGLLVDCERFLDCFKEIV